jgi:hypothetical protein
MTGPRIPTGPKAIGRDELQKAIIDPRWHVMARTGLDPTTIGTWDSKLVRRKRVAVPVDVQAFVVRGTGGEVTVPLKGDASDPAPFATGTVRPAGVHLHWALPDALLRGEPASPDENGSAEDMAFPALPDRWVVLRMLRPLGVKTVHVRGWAIDAKRKVALPLETFAGSFDAATGAIPFARLDGEFGGSLMWTASYSASEGRFTFHDPLSDLPLPTTVAPRGLQDNSASYVVCGWWNTLTEDPLAASAGESALLATLEALKWSLDDDATGPVTDSKRMRRDDNNASIGLMSPSDDTKVSYVSNAGPKVTQKIYGVGTGNAFPVSEASEIVMAPPTPRFSTLLHGSVFGVPTTGSTSSADDRPRASDVTIAIGLDVDDVVAALGAGVLGTRAAQREQTELLMAAFASDMLERLDTADGITDLAEHEHSDGFDSRPGPAIPGTRVDRFRKSDTAAANPLSVGRKGRGALAPPSSVIRSPKLSWLQGVEMQTQKSLFAKSAVAPAQSSTEATTASRTGSKEASVSNTTVIKAPPAVGVREVTRPAPRLFFPQPPMLALRGVKPNLRHNNDGRFEDDDRLYCRYTEECVSELQGALRGADLLPTIGSGAIPEEVLLIARESVLIDPYGTAWLSATAGSGMSGAFQVAVNTRIIGEMARLYGTDATYDGSSHLTAKRLTAVADAWAPFSVDAVRVDRELTAVLADHSVVKGTPPSPVAITTWRQPWAPLWVEWSVTIAGGITLDGWRLGDLDLEPRAGSNAPAVTTTRTLTGRSPLSTGVAKTMHQGIARWLEAEARRDAGGEQGLDPASESALGRLGTFLQPLDMASASMDGIREQILGINYQGQFPLNTPTDGSEPVPIASALPVPLLGGSLTINAMRVVDAFGRTLALNPAATVTTSVLETKTPGTITVRPRLQHAARWVVRFVGAPDPTSADPAARPNACVDQITPEAMINPVAGFLLPDHIDESLEVFATDGSPIGELSHDPITGAVMWEAAPGRPVPPDAGPFTDLSASQAPIADVAAGVLSADVLARSLASPPDTTSLSAMLRAIDTTLWTIDTYSAIGSPSIAGLVGRPIAVVRATIMLDTPNDTAEVFVTHAGGNAARKAVFDALAEVQFPFRLGAMERADDAVLGFYLNDDYSRLHLVDKVIASQAPPSGRMQGALGQLGDDIDLTSTPIDHPYIVAEDEILVRPGQEIAVTILMLPAGKLHLTSGILPRKALYLADDWVTPGLNAISPSIRVGPVLVDPSEIRLPLVSAMGPRQRFTRRTGPLTWREDPITASTQAAFLPRTPHEAQEGWIRVNPETDAEIVDGGTP